jgi:hypothetical protein
VTGRATPGRRLSLFGGVAIALGVLVLALPAAELVLRSRPFSVPPLLGPPADGRLAPVREGFVPFSVAVAPVRPRVLYVGASTEAGYPFGPASSLAAWVQRVLAFRGVDVEVVPVACVGLDAHQTLDIFPQLFALRPAAIVVGVGHNEFLRAERLIDPRWWLRLELTRRLAQLMAEPDHVFDAPPPGPGHDFDRPALLAAFRSALVGMQGEVDDHAVPLLFTVPVCNLADSPPLLGGDARLGEDPDLAFDRGRARLAAGELAAARAAFETARDDDLWPERAPRPLIEAVLATGHAVRTDLAIDAAAAHGIPGDELFLDHCHPSPAGARVLAIAVADALEQLRLWAPSGRAGTAPELPVLMADARLSDADVLAARADVALEMAGLALMTRHSGRLAAEADRRLAGAGTGLSRAGEVEMLRALLALQRGELGDAQRRLQDLARASPQALSAAGVEVRRFPWLRELFERNGLPLPGGP